MGEILTHWTFKKSWHVPYLKEKDLLYFENGRWRYWCLNQRKGHWRKVTGENILSYNISISLKKHFLQMLSLAFFYSFVSACEIEIYGVRFVLSRFTQRSSNLEQIPFYTLTSQLWHKVAEQWYYQCFSADVHPPWRITSAEFEQNVIL